MKFNLLAACNGLLLCLQTWETLDVTLVKVRAAELFGWTPWFDTDRSTLW